MKGYKDMNLFLKNIAVASALCMTVPFFNLFDNVQNNVSALSGSCVAEYLNRGITAVNTGNGMLVSWRFLANDADSTVFNLYRDGTLVYTSNSEESTCFLDTGGSPSSKYTVEALEGGKIASSEKCTMISGTSYFDVPLDQPAASGCTYSPNDCSVGDVDGDGTYELFVKWDPSTSKDNSQKGDTNNVYIDCYRLDGTKLWRIDLGVNIRAGAHYTQFLVADFDLDGKAELTCKTADGTVDGTGKVIGDSSAVYRNSSGYILTGNEYYTLFDGATGAALDTVNYNPPRGTVSSWGDKYGNRVDRFLGAVCYLDGVHPSAVTVRGYYTRMTACAYDVVDKKLVQRWYFDSGNSSSAAGYGDGNHNCMPADVDGDGKQELVLGATCLDDNGKVLWCLNTGHGDAMHLGDLLPDRKGLELWICHEEKPYGVSLVDASNGKTIFHKDGSGDTGRCCADNVWSGNDGAEFWGLNNDVFDGAGNTLSCRRPAINFLSYWDGDLEREILDGYTDSPATISKMGADGKLTTLLSTDGYYTCNTTKGTPCLSADIFGDWREELVVRASNGKSVRIYSTTYDTDYRITTLMHDIQYRTQVAGQNTAYNQPPHASFYLGSEKGVPARETVTVLNSTSEPVQKPAVISEGTSFMLRNKNSGMYMTVEGENAVNGANICQTEKPERASIWKAFASDDDGYYYLCSGLNNSFCLDVTAHSADNGTNIELYQSNKKTAQKFMFMENEDGSYTIRTHVSGGTSCVEIVNGLITEGANVQEWELNGASCQDWYLENATEPGEVMDTSKVYNLLNMNSNLYMEVAGAKKENGANVQQWGADAPNDWNSWILTSAENGYYYISSKMADGKTWYLTVAEGKSAAGINVCISEKDGTSSQLFKFVKNTDGSYTLMTKASKDGCVLEIQDENTQSGGNVIQNTYSGSLNQKWLLSEAGTLNIAGDADQNGIVNISDFITLQRYMLGISELTADGFGAADINSDGKISIIDYIMLKEILLIA